MNRPRLAVVSAALAQRPGVAGHAWVILNWLLGLRSLGYDVLFVDRLDPGMRRQPDQPAEQSAEWRWAKDVLDQAGPAGAEAVLLDGGDCLGLDRAALLERCRAADVLFNFMGYLDDPELIAACGGPVVFVDIDPGFPQMWQSLGLCSVLDGHDAYVTVGLRVGAPASRVPTCGLDWITTPPPVDLAAWGEAPAPPSPDGRMRVSEVATWRGPFGPVDFDGTTFGLRVHEFRRYADLPRALPDASFEMALAIDPADRGDAAALRAGGWCLRDPQQEASDLHGYRRYVRAADVEFTVAKQMYVRSGGGWFSDRSACYLASGRPVVAQETGYSDFLPTGPGLLSYTEPGQAVEALREVAADLPGHRRAARLIAEEHLDARKVLRRLTTLVGAA